jgi:hypothetical protein
VDLTIKNNQKYCVFHLSDASEATAVSVNFSTEDSYDILYFSDGATERPLSGDGSFHHHSDVFSLFTWISDLTTVSKSFAIRVSAPQSKLPPVRLNYTAQSWPDVETDPLILHSARKRSVAPPAQQPYANADAEMWSRPTDAEPTERSVALIAVCAGICLGVGVTAWVCRVQLRRGSDSPHAGILSHGDLCGVDEGERVEVRSLWDSEGGTTDRLHIDRSEGEGGE